jgi:DNA-binding transcriptional MocR family regulator
MFTLQDQYHHCMRLSYGHTWNEKMEATLKTLGRLAGQEL